jgi:hypothetical protein
VNARSDCAIVVRGFSLQRLASRSIDVAVLKTPDRSVSLEVCSVNSASRVEMSLAKA